MKPPDSLEEHRFAIHFKSGAITTVVAPSQKWLIDRVEANKPFTVATDEGPLWLRASQVAAVQSMDPHMEPSKSADGTSAQRQNVRPVKRRRPPGETDATFDDGEDATDDDDDIPT